jgi:hypothetical protein
MAFLNALIPRAVSPMTSGIFPFPNIRSSTMATIIQCQRLSTPTANSPNVAGRRRSIGVAIPYQPQKGGQLKLSDESPDSHRSGNSDEPGLHPAEFRQAIYLALTGCIVLPSIFRECDRSYNLRERLNIAVGRCLRSSVPAIPARGRSATSRQRCSPSHGGRWNELHPLLWEAPVART